MNLKRVQTDLQNLDKVAKSTISRLQKSKLEAVERTLTLQDELQNSLPLSDFIRQEHKLNLYIAKSKILMDRERSWVEFKNRQDVETSRSDALGKQARDFELKLLESQATVSRLESALKQFGTASNASSVAVEATSKSVKLEVQLEMFAKRTEMSEKAAQAALQSQIELKKRLDSMEDMYMDAKEETIKAEEEIMKLRLQFEGGASKEQYKDAIESLTVKNEEIAVLKEELKQSKQLVDIAQTQASDLAALRTAEFREKEILRAAIRELQMESDDKLLIGKLHHHVLTLQLNEANHSRNMERVKEKCLRLEHANVQVLVIFYTVM